MASEGVEGGGGDVQLQTQNQPVLPQYPEMIIDAIKALNDTNGSKKSAISKQIEATYGNLPPAHNTLLAHHLNRMKSAGQLHFVKNNYVIPDPDAPPRRGRGRPPKPKDPTAPVGVSGPSRPRGRPPKSTEGGESVTGKKRGRPPKPAGEQPPPPNGEKRGRGRPPKVKTHAAETTVGA